MSFCHMKLNINELSSQKKSQESCRGLDGALAQEIKAGKGARHRPPRVQRVWTHLQRYFTIFLFFEIICFFSSLILGSILDINIYIYAGVTAWPNPSSEVFLLLLVYNISWFFWLSIQYQYLYICGGAACMNPSAEYFSQFLYIIGLFLAPYSMAISTFICVEGAAWLTPPAEPFFRFN